MIEPINHIALFCNDVQATEAFYTRHFGFKRARVFKRGEPDEFLMLRAGNCRIELFKTRRPGHMGGEQDTGFAHLAFNVEDMEATLKRLSEEGIQAEPITEDAGNVKGLRVCFFKDPDGNRIELMQNYVDDPELWGDDS